MSVKKMEEGDIAYCDGCDIMWTKFKNGDYGWKLYSVEGDIYLGEDAFHWGITKEGQSIGYCEYEAKDEPRCPECKETGMLATVEWGRTWQIECNCHDTPIEDDPFKAWKHWEKYCKA